ncbi:hypothetical protein M405DRAFT_818395 [Rhizopogon salebrosus TDB-379]|nr:hypothetical protein M405DRAFT_818395 [Rhizopogon salebrosus TDB-379]
MPLGKILQRYHTETARHDAVLSSCGDGRHSDTQIRGGGMAEGTYDLRPKVGLKVTGRSVYRKYVSKAAYDRAHFVAEECERVQ